MPTPIVDNSAAGRLTREYAAYLRQERGLVASTIRGYADFAARFVRSERPRLDWGRLTATEVTSFVLRSTRESRSIGTSKLTVTHLRSLLRFLHVRGAIDHDLSACVPAVAGWRLAGVPAALEQTEIGRLLSVFDRSKTGLRDAAVVRLLLRLGLRAGEVAALNLDDVDWRAGELSVHGKGRHQSRLPFLRTLAACSPRTSATAGPTQASGASSCAAMRPTLECGRAQSSTSFRQHSCDWPHGERASASAHRRHATSSPRRVAARESRICFATGTSTPPRSTPRWTSPR